MLPDGTLEPFDWQFTTPFSQWQTSEPVGDSFGASPRQRRQNTEIISIRKAMEFIDEVLRNYQGSKINVDLSKGRIFLPYAVYLAEGTEFECIDTKEIYKVTHVFKKKKNPTGEVLVSSGTGRVLKQTDRLRAVHGEKNSVNFMHAYPQSAPLVYEWNKETGQLVEDGRPWTDTITWRVIRSEPGSLGKDPFGTPKELRPRFRDFVYDEKDPSCDYVTMILGQLFDTIIQFDIWTQTPERGQMLAEWFNDFLELHRWVLMYNGVQTLYFWRQQPDALSTRWRNDIVSTSLQWYFRTEKNIHRKIRKISDISLEMDVLTHGEHTAIQTAPAADPYGCVEPTGIKVTSELIDGSGKIAIDWTGELRL